MLGLFALSIEDMIDLHKILVFAQLKKHILVRIEFPTCGL